jgi:hypothetical protein
VIAARGLVPIVLFVLLATARPAAAEVSRTPLDTRIDAVRVADQADGSIVSIKLRGRTRPRIVRSVERLVAIAIADVDADGELDILAATIRHTLVLWRNAGRGHFVLARLPKARDALARVPRVSRDKHASAHDEPGEGSPDTAISHIETDGDPLVLRSLVLSESFSPVAQYRAAATGRAPPARA